MQPREAALASIDAKIDALAQCRELVSSTRFMSASLTIEHCAGRIIVTGIGKSGHIARKIASTLMSTGTPAAFLHPAEAMHGDVGMIRPGDVVLMLSNSGETDELEPVMDFAIDGRCPVIIITSRPEARLSQRAHVVLAMPRLPEGCPVERAPMASTATQMAIGDALAAAVMAARGFTAEDFARFHHGGYLGRQARAVA